MIVYSGELYRHLAMIHTIGHEVLDHPQPGGAVRAGRRAQAVDDALALRHSDRGRLDRVISPGGFVDLIRPFSSGSVHGFGGK